MRPRHQGCRSGRGRKISMLAGNAHVSRRLELNFAGKIR